MENFDNNFEFYRDFRKEDEIPFVEEREVPNSRLTSNYSRALNSSLASTKIQPVSRKSTKTLKINKSLFVLALVSTMAVSSLLTLGVVEFVDNVQTTISISEFNNDMRVKEAMKDASWSYVDDDGNRVWGYNHDTLANYVDGLGKYHGWHNNPDAALFAVYNQLSQRKTQNIDEIVKRVDGDYNSWDDYLIQHGFVDKNGNPSNDIYKKEMTDRIAQGIESDTFDQNHGMKR